MEMSRWNKFKTWWKQYWCEHRSLERKEWTENGLMQSKTKCTDCGKGVPWRNRFNINADIHTLLDQAAADKRDRNNDLRRRP